MKASFLFIVSFIIMMSVKAQDSWKIMLNNKLLISTSVSNEIKNTKTVRKNDWDKDGYLDVNYKEAQKSGWKHSLHFSDQSGKELLINDSAMSAHIKISSLKKLFREKRMLKIYMVISPPDPMMAAPTRMIHLGTLKLP